MAFGPRKISFQDVGMNTFWALIAGFVGSLLILLIVFMTSSIIDIPGTFSQASLGNNRNPMFPFVLSFITFFATMITIFLCAKLLHMIDAERYKKSSVISLQLAFFGILTYICITPVYIYTGMINYDNIMLVFIIHCLILSFGSSLLLEILNNYRSILLSFYGSFIALFFTTLIGLLLFTSLESGYAKLISLLLLLPLIQSSLIFFKGICEMLYYQYYSFTNMDQLGDIFSQIERKEAEELREEIQKNTL